MLIKFFNIDLCILFSNSGWGWGVTLRTNHLKTGLNLLKKINWFESLIAKALQMSLEHIVFHSCQVFVSWPFGSSSWESSITLISTTLFFISGWGAVRPDVWLERSSISTKSCPKNSSRYFYLKIAIFEMALKVTKLLGYFWNKNCQQEFLKITQSGHTGGSSHWDHITLKWFF